MLIKSYKKKKIIWTDKKGCEMSLKDLLENISV